MPRLQPHQTEAQPPLYQVWVDENHPRHGRRSIPVGPKMQREFLGPIMEMIGRRIASGVEKRSAQPWSNPRLEVCPDTIREPDSPFTREDRQNDLVGDYRSETAQSAPSSLLLH